MSEERWHRLVELASADDDAVGLVLTGGRGKGVASERSDWDGLLVVLRGLMASIKPGTWQGPCSE